jgi:cytochrome P450
MTTVSDGRTESAVYYDPYDAGIVAQPYPVYARLREEAQLYYNAKYDFWALSRHSDVEKALANWQTFSNARSDILELVQSAFDMPPGVMMFEDPPMHTMLRGLMSRVFTPRRMAAIEDQIRQYCVRCLDPLVGSDGFDVVAELAAMMPMRVIGMLPGIPEADQTGFRDANDANLRTRRGADEGGQRRSDRRRPDVRGLRRMAVQQPVGRPDDRTARRRVRRRTRGHPQAHPQGGAALHPGGGRRRQ